MDDFVSTIAKKEGSEVLTFLASASSMSENAYANLLRALVTHVDPSVRDEVAARLGEIAEAADERRLLLLSRDEDWPVRCSAASSLARFNGLSAERRLYAMAAKDRVGDVRRWAIYALSDRGAIGLGEFVRESLKSEKSIRVRYALLDVGTRLGDETCEVELQSLLENLGDLKRKDRKLIIRYAAERESE